MHGVLTRVRQWLRFGAAQRELEEEMATHHAMKREALARAGVRTEDLNAATERAMGNEVYMREEARGVWLAPWTEALGQGLKLGVARLRRAPGFAAVAILTLALGIGANTAIFSVVEAVMLRPLPYPNANRILTFRFANSRGVYWPSFTMAEVNLLRDHVPAFSAAAGYRGDGVNELDHDGKADWAAGEVVTSGFFRALGIKPRMGRGFTRSDEDGGRADAVVLSDHLWRTAFGASPAALGQTLRYDGRACTIVGVLPRGFTFLENPADVYVAMQPDNGSRDAGMNTEVIGRLRPGATAAEAAAQTAALSREMKARGMLPPWALGVAIRGYQAQQDSQVQTNLWFLMGIVGLLLLIACANVAGLLLARTLARAPELALRRALGAGRGRLFVQFLTEGIVLAAAGGVVGLGLAALGLHALVGNLKPWSLPFAGPVGLDGRVLAFTAAVACGAAVVFATAAAWQGSARHLAVNRFQRRGRARDIMVAGEVALSLLLLAGAGLLLRSLASLEHSPLGFEPAGRTLVSVQLPASIAKNDARAEQAGRQMLERLQALPGIRAAASSNVVPLLGQGNLVVTPVGNSADASSVEVRTVSPSYFRVMGIPLLHGRALRSSDSASAPLVAVVSASLAREWFPGHPLGGRIRIGVYGNKVYGTPPVTNAREVIGVVGDVRTRSVSEPMRPTIYVPAPQLRWGNSLWFVLRGKTGEEPIRDAIEAVQPGSRVTWLEGYPELISQELAQPKFEAQLTGLFAVLALILTAVGLYGLLAYSVTEQTREIGVRMALGAPRGRLLLQVAGRGMLLAAIGVAAGVGLTIPLSKFVTSLLSGVKPNDAVTLLGAAVLMLVVAGLACLGPALRATRVDAVTALRSE